MIGRIKSALASAALSLLRSLDYKDWMRGFSSEASSSGIEVTDDLAIGEVTIFACVRAISWNIASLPRAIYRRTDAGRRREREHPVARLIRRPNPWMNPFKFWGTLAAAAAWHGESFAQIVWDASRRPVELWPLPLETSPVDVGGQLFYDVQWGGKTRRLRASDVLHFSWMTRDGVQAFNPVKIAAEAVGLALAAERFAGKFFSNRANIAGVLTYPGSLDKDQLAEIKKGWRDTYSGLGNAHDIGILSADLKYQAIGTEPEKSQMTQTMEAAAVRMCRLIGVPPHVAGILEKMSYASVEQAFLAFGIHTIRPCLEAIESECDFKLFADYEQDELYMEHNMDAMLRGDYKTRMEGHLIAVNNGLATRNEIREKENQNPLEDGRGDDIIIPMNHMAIPKGGLTAAGPAPVTSAPAPGRADDAPESVPPAPEPPEN